ncbi:LLM class F420-dependent oxidoreductase, partial [Streptomyces virginiae]
MELSMMLDYAGNPRRAADEAAALESAGLDAVWVAAAWGFDSPTIMG